MNARNLIITVSLLSLSACASVPKAQENSQTPSGKPEGLSARTLAVSECGLFVWTADAQKQFILFGQSQNSRAEWFSPKGETALTLRSQSGAPTQGQYPKQVYGTLTLDLRDPQAIDSGTRYRAGTLTRRDDQGWDTVTPVVGLSACKPATNTAS